MQYDDFIAAGLYDADAPNAAERRELIDHWVARGFTLEDLIGCEAEQAYWIARMLAHPDPPKVSLRDIAHESGLSLEQVILARRAMGFAVEDADKPDVAATFVGVANTVAVGIELFGESRAIAISRVVGSAVRSMAEASWAMFADTVLDAHATELEVSQANELAAAAWDMLIVAVGHLMWERLTTNEYAAKMLSGDVRVGVAFVDLANSVSWGSALSARDHALALGRFEAKAYALAVDHNTRVVKFIGDEVMVVGTDAVAPYRVAAELCEFVRGDDQLPLARAAVNFGRVTLRDADYFGAVVDIAARATKLAKPGRVLVTGAVCEAIADDRKTITPLGPVVIRGLAEAIELFEVTTTS